MSTSRTQQSESKQARLGIAPGHPGGAPQAGAVPVSAGNFSYLLAIVLTLTTLSLFHVWSREKVILLTLDVSTQNRTLNDVTQERERLTLETNRLQNPGRVQQYAAHELGMVVPSENQIVVVDRASEPRP